MLQRGITLAVLITFLVAIVGWLIVERARHARNLNATPVNDH